MNGKSMLVALAALFAVEAAIAAAPGFFALMRHSMAAPRKLTDSCVNPMEIPDAVLICHFTRSMPVSISVTSRDSPP